MDLIEGIDLVIFDVAGTTAQDGGLVTRAFESAMVSLGVESGSEELREMIAYVNATMGERKIDVFTYLCKGDSARAERAHELFVNNYIQLVLDGELEEFDGITEFFAKLRIRNIAVAITTGFPREILDRIIESLHWREILDFSVAASEVAKGRPAPDMVQRVIALYSERTGLEITAASVAVLGDTESDMQSGVAAGAKVVAGVTSGAHTEAQLRAAGATHILAHATDLI